MGVLIAIKCPHCQSIDVIKNGKSSSGQQRFRCLNSECPYQTFGLDSAYPGRKREVKQQILEMTLNGSGVRDIARVLHVSPTTVIQVLKKNRAFGTSQSATLTAAETGGSRG